MTLSLNFVQAQSQFEALKQEFPDQKAVYIERSRTIELRVEDGQIQGEVYTHKNRMVLNEKGSVYNEETVDYSGFSPLKSISAETLVPHKSRYKKIPVKEFKEKAVFDGNIFHDDSKELQFYFAGLVPGAIAQMEYVHEVKEPRFLQGHYFISALPVKESKFTIRTTKDIGLGFSEFHLEGSAVEVVKREEKKYNEYTFVYKNLMPYKDENAAPNFRYSTPHVRPYIKWYFDGKDTHKILPDLEHLYAWYYDLVSGVNAEPSPLLKPIVDSICKGLKDEEEKVKQMFYWVQDNIKYVAFEEGLGGFVPREANLVCERKYGDCKDKSSILKEMLSLAGIPSYFTWIGSRDLPYSYYELPTPGVDNHMILAYKNPLGEWVFLDGTAENLPYGMPTDFIQGKEALIGKGKDDFEVVKVPVVPAEYNFVKGVEKFSIEGDIIRCQGGLSLGGFQGKLMTRRLLLRKPEDWKEYMEDFLTVGNNKFLLQSLDIQGLGDRSKALQINYEYELHNYLQSYEDEMYLNMNFDRSLDDASVEKDREQALEVDYQQFIKGDFHLEIPEGYTLQSLPKGMEFKHPAFSAFIRYEAEGNQVRRFFEIELNHIFLQPEHFNAWNQMIKALNKAYKEVVVLKKQ